MDFLFARKYGTNDEFEQWEKSSALKLRKKYNISLFVDSLIIVSISLLVVIFSSKYYIITYFGAFIFFVLISLHKTGKNNSDNVTEFYNSLRANIEYSNNDKYNQNISWENYLDENFKPTGTRTNLSEIKTSNVSLEIQEIMNSSEKVDNIITGKEKIKKELFIGKENPYTSETIQNYNDIVLYFRMYQLDCGGINPLTALGNKCEDK